MADRVSQVDVEVIGYTNPNARVSQVDVEVIGYTNPNARVSQVCIEILWFPPGATSPLISMSS